MTNPLAGLERTVGKEMFDKVRGEKESAFVFVTVSYRNNILGQNGTYSNLFYPPSLRNYLYWVTLSLFIAITNLVRFKIRTSFVSEQEESVANSSKIWHCPDFAESRSSIWTPLMFQISIANSSLEASMSVCQSAQWLAKLPPIWYLLQPTMTFQKCHTKPTTGMSAIHPNSMSPL